MRHLAVALQATTAQEAPVGLEMDSAQVELAVAPVAMFFGFARRDADERNNVAAHGDGRVLHPYAFNSSTSTSPWQGFGAQ